MAGGDKKYGRNLDKCARYSGKAFIHNKVKAIIASHGPEAAQAWLEHFTRYGERLAVGQKADGTLVLQRPADIKRAQALAAGVRAATPDQVISWVRDHKAKIVRFHNVSGYLDTFEMDDQYRIGELALQGKL